MERSASTRKVSRQITIWLALLVFFLSLALSAPTILRQKKVFIDEPGWVSASIAAAQRVISGRFAPDAWNDTDLSAWGDLNPPAGKLMIGIPLVLSYQGNPPHFRRIWCGWHSYAQNQADGNFPPWGLLVRARFICSAIFALVTVAAFLLASDIGGLIAGALTVLLLLTDRLYVHWSTSVITDGPYVLSTILLALCCLKALRSVDSGVAFKWLIGASLFAALAANIKISAILPAGILILATIVRITVRGDESNKRRQLLRWSLGCLVIATVAISATNPSYWIDLRMIDVPAIKAEARAWPQVRREIRANMQGSTKQLTFRDTCPHIYNLMRPLGLPIGFIRWRDRSRDQIKGMQQSMPDAVPNGSKTIYLARQIVRYGQSFRGEWLLILCGVVLMMIDVFKPKSPEQSDGAYILLACTAGQWLYLMTLPFFFDRYFLPSTAVAQIVCAYALVRLVSIPICLIQRRHTSSDVSTG